MEEPPDIGVEGHPGEEPPGQSEFRQPGPDEIVLWGTIATVHYRVSSPEYPDRDEGLYDSYLFEEDLHRFVESDTTRSLEERLGSDFEVHVTLVRGSLVLLVTVAVAGGVEAAYKIYKAIGEYPQFRQGLILLISDLQKFIRFHVENRLGFGVEVTTEDIQPGPSLAAAENYVAFAPAVNQFRNFLVYISIITTALFVCAVILLFRLL